MGGVSRLPGLALVSEQSLSVHNVNFKSKNLIQSFLIVLRKARLDTFSSVKVLGPCRPNRKHASDKGIEFCYGISNFCRNWMPRKWWAPMWGTVGRTQWGVWTGKEGFCWSSSNPLGLPRMTELTTRAWEYFWSACYIITRETMIWKLYYRYEKGWGTPRVVPLNQKNV